MFWKLFPKKLMFAAVKRTLKNSPDEMFGCPEYVAFWSPTANRHIFIAGDFSSIVKSTKLEPMEKFETIVF